MNFQLDQNTIILGLVVIFIAWYFYQEAKESFKSQRGVQASKKGHKATPEPVVAVPASAPVPKVVVPVPVAAPVPVPTPKVVVTPPPAAEDDFAGLL